MPLPLAYYLTWTCYGQRLHGDSRGSVDRFHNTPGTSFLPPDSAREQRERENLRTPPVFLSTPMRAIVDAALLSLCADRNWHLIARNARPTHIHALVNCRGQLSPERTLAQFKARATRDLRIAKLVNPDAPLWTHHGSTRWVNSYKGLYAAIGYINGWQSGPNREMLEKQKRETREHIEALKAWLISQGLPEDGRTVVIGESNQERTARVNQQSLGTSVERSETPPPDDSLRSPLVPNAQGHPHAHRQS